MKLSKIVFTGGPCAGKSTTIEEIKKHFENQGYKVFVVSETAREVIANGMIPKSDYEYTLKFQDSIMKIQSLKEIIIEHFAKLESINNPTIILYDRSIVDNRAYLETEEDYRNILKANHLKELEVLEKYDLVIHLVSLASVDYMNYETDAVRSEDKYFAKELDKKTLNAYLLHRNLKIVLPTPNQQDKINIVIKHINNLLENKKEDNLTICNYYNQEEITELFKTSNFDNSKNVLVSEYYDPSSSYRLICKEYNNELVYEEIFENNEEVIVRPITQIEFCLKLTSLPLIKKDYHYDTIFVNNFEINKICKNETFSSLTTQHNEYLENIRTMKKIP